MNGVLWSDVMVVFWEVWWLWWICGRELAEVVVVIV